MDSISIMGEWWLPNSPNHKVSGKLEFDPAEGIELRLMGELKEEDANRKERFRNKDPLQPEIILGETAEGEDITIIECYESNRRNHRTPESHKIRLWIKGQYLIKGEHFSKKENIEFQRIIFTFPYLEKYLNFRSTYTEMMPQGEDYDRKAEFELPKTLEASLEDLELNIWFRTKGVFNSSAQLVH